ncbi:MAG: hypothetical protein UU73_C0007G0012 [Candidatus Daviesbacteria bacterium GW2011_GWA1_41_61]|nr:MAG: hypothetical protein UU26_C0014G0002 [Candidatus Daviesbacteria bacterium GW2011_GWC1_40_9]KKR92746.1 MAG: hypothetical protein UU44_C0005G0076 [Candidatus Daviesbacteria bacterium GW2011_GWB1_41_15]KKS14505.1 MAG: hypothetical protein UU73_C0007G0012 [Candidatus Daviesbacteria bacterium GW2011_GWA1_41_61]
MTNLTNPKKPGGYQNLIIYQQAVIIFDLTVLFCKTYLTHKSNMTNLSYRTIDQMIQAVRSGKQNIVEGSLEKSLKMNIKLTGVARASFGELLEDYKDFLRTNNLKLWDKEDPRVLKIRALRVSLNETNKSNWTHWTNNPESFCNLLITLINKENYLLDKMLKVLEEKFISEGGYSENLFKRRLAFREGKLDK